MGALALAWAPLVMAMWRLRFVERTPNLLRKLARAPVA
jgi:hypothetical protein